MNCTPPMKEGQVRKTERNEREKEGERLEIGRKLKSRSVDTAYQGEAPLVSL